MTQLSLPTNRPLRWKLFLIVWLSTICGMLAAIPYANTLLAPALATSMYLFALPWLLAFQTVFSSIWAGVLAGVGLFLAARIGLGLPFVEGWLGREPLGARLRATLPVSIAVGVLAGLLSSGLDLWVFGPRTQPRLDSLGLPIPDGVAVPLWQGLLASLYSGLVEEVLLRLALLTAVAWLGSLASHKDDGRPTVAVLWVANIVIAIPLGLRHLPVSAAIGLPVDVWLVARALAFNGLTGLAYGWLYWTHGLESAALAHFLADSVFRLVPAS